jgi:hypothetical protein
MFKTVSQLLRPERDREVWFRSEENDEKTRGFGMTRLRNMFSGPGIFTPPEFPVLSLEVQAQIPVTYPPKRSQHRLLVRHFVERFFNNEAVSTDGDTKARLLQVVWAVALPGMVVALFLFPLYHAPLPRPFWSQVSDHYFYAMYSFVAVGAASIFAWDLLFPDLLDVFVLSPLPIAAGRLFVARIVAGGLVLGVFLAGANAPGTIFYPLLSEPPGLARHFFAHLLAVLGCGAFAAAFFLGVQGVMVAVMGERWFRAVVPFLQGISVMSLLLTLLAFPVLSRFIEVLVNLSAARYFPPFWFLGIYESTLAGSSTLPVFRELARIGWLAIAVTTALTIVSYPLAYRRRMHFLVEGSSASRTSNWIVRPIHHLLHATLLRNRIQRGIYHFISYSLLRTQRHRVYLAMYGGLGLALLTACALLLKVNHGGVGLALSPDGLLAGLPIVAFWTIAGLRNAFLSPMDKRGAWVFRVILGRPGPTQLATTTLWILPCALVLTLTMVALIGWLGPPELREWKSLLCQALIAIGLCLLLTDILFLKVRSLPFTGDTKAPTTNLAFILLQYFGLFPPLVWLSAGLEPWLKTSVWHVAETMMVIVVAHYSMSSVHRKNVLYYADLIDGDDEEEFPQRLGLRY